MWPATTVPTALVAPGSSGWWSGRHRPLTAGGDALDPQAAHQPSDTLTSDPDGHPGSGTIRELLIPAEERFEMHRSRIVKVGLIAAAATLLLVVPAFGTPKASIKLKVSPVSIKPGHKVTLKLSGFA